ncbi:MAG: hypothetical protein ACM3X1_09055 [Ignavibacteriales bacterium]
MHQIISGYMSVEGNEKWQQTKGVVMNVVTNEYGEKEHHSW